LTFRILDGVSDHLSHYGLELARLADLPADVLEEGKRVAKELQVLQTRHEEESASSKIALRRKVLLKVRRSCPIW
jgi:DNA mismatch repair protein MSH4